MKTVTIRNLEIGTGMPKICVPIFGKTESEILEHVQSLEPDSCDLIEWRADFFEGVFDFQRVLSLLGDLRAIIGEKPLLFTFRTAGEGGQRSISDDDYRSLNCSVAQSGLVDLVDVELFSGEETVNEIMQVVHQFHTFVILSNHDFEETPSQAEIVSRLRLAQKLGGDILKIAVMPRCRRDVLTLLSATEEMAAEYADRPLITMSMGGSGAVSRLSGEYFGSAITFASAGKGSAPGQLPAAELKKILTLLHTSM